ncbi:hypothetical protein AGABI2DRAFT_195351 [Agaricus bisporus var. bisporus H97]|uniref:hypothetical protein n=1 Tax=Agaricus bisporus var. bisporus (strain H97 / ATCC MYA-4626 / FGSC 10389) TaxID=936046 RepID=UPI00029F64AD|nr:hypothetical protein AGABI2DRAFT_195351 [Agaricus bisporus var. bisporus H97]EKV43118.1 hypothetical protein AGABI2DRAFT_195351 [Agaricus bisporus var. bisporus H97]
MASTVNMVCLQTLLRFEATLYDIIALDIRDSHYLSGGVYLYVSCNGSPGFEVNLSTS